MIRHDISVTRATVLSCFYSFLAPLLESECHYLSLVLDACLLFDLCFISSIYNKIGVIN